TPGNPITNWFVSHNRGPSASPAYFSAPALALTEDWPMVTSPSGPADPTQIQPELGTAIDYNADGLADLFLHSGGDTSPTWIVLSLSPTTPSSRTTPTSPNPSRWRRRLGRRRSSAPAAPPTSL